MGMRAAKHNGAALVLLVVHWTASWQQVAPTLAWQDQTVVASLPPRSFHHAVVIEPYVLFP